MSDIVLQVDQDFVAAVNGASMAVAVPATDELKAVGLNIVFAVEVDGVPHGKALIRAIDTDSAMVIALSNSLEPQEEATAASAVA